MSLDFSRKVSYDLGAYDVKAATADQTRLYVLAADSNNSGRVYTLDKQGNVQNNIPAAYDSTTAGFCKIGNGYVTARRSNRLINLVVTPFIGQNFQQINTTINGYPRLLFWDAVASRYALFYDFVGQSNYRYRVAFLSASGAVETQLYMAEDFLRGEFTGDKYYLASTLKNAKQIKIFDKILSDTGLFQTIQAVTLSGLAFSQNQLIVFDADEIFFYGPEPLPPPVGPVPVRQLFANYEGKAERFDVVRDSGGFEVIANNVEILRQTALGLVGVAGTQTLTQRFAQVEITPVWTVPNAKIGDKIFSHSGDADTEPSAVPTNRTVYTIQGFSDVGPTYRQSFICTAVG